jgi:SAM-dependent methyltransferase
LADTINGFDPRSFEELVAVEPENFWFVVRNELIVGLIERFFPKARHFMEVGCGTGYVLRAVAGSREWERVVGSELHPSGLAYARERLPSNVELFQMDARNIPIFNVFDLTAAFDVVEHVDDDGAVLRGMRKATRKGGGIILTVPQHPWLWSQADIVAHHQRRYRRNELEAKLCASGFELVFSSSYTALLLPFMAINRVKSRRDKTRESAFNELRLNRYVNGLFAAILKAEVRMTLAGVRWPAGGSRVVVGRAV